jgi:hypothetical protein
MPPPPQKATCNGSVLHLPEGRAYKLTENGFEGGGAYRTTLLFKDAQVDTLPFNGSKDRTVTGPGDVKVCSQNQKGGAGGCGFACVGADPEFRFTYPAGDGFGDKSATIRVTPQ